MSDNNAGGFAMERVAHDAINSIAHEHIDEDEITVKDSSYSDRIEAIVELDRTVDFHTGSDEVTFANAEYTHNNAHLGLLFHTYKDGAKDVSFSIDMRL